MTGIVWSSQDLLSLLNWGVKRLYTDPSTLLPEQHYVLMVRFKGLARIGVIPHEILNANSVSFPGGLGLPVNPLGWCPAN